MDMNVVQVVKSLRVSKYWLVFYKMNMYLYQFYGDAQPRFLLDIGDCVISGIKKKVDGCQVVLNRPSDGRFWTFEFESKGKAYVFTGALGMNRQMRERIGSEAFDEPPLIFGFK